MESLELQQRMALERLIVRHLIDTAIKAGWKASAVDDGGDERVPCANADEAMEAVFAVDESYIYFTKDVDGKKAKGMAVIVLGNGIDCISDHSIAGLFVSEVMDVSTAYVDTLNDTGVAGMYALEVQKTAALLGALEALVTVAAPHLTKYRQFWRDSADGQASELVEETSTADELAAALDAIAMAKGEAA